MRISFSVGRYAPKRMERVRVRPLQRPNEWYGSTIREVPRTQIGEDHIQVVITTADWAEAAWETRYFPVKMRWSFLQKGLDASQWSSVWGRVLTSAQHPARHQIGGDADVHRALA